LSERLPSSSGTKARQADNVTEQRKRTSGGSDTAHTEGWTRRQFVASLAAGAVVGGGLRVPVWPTRSPLPRADEFGARVATAWFDLALQLVKTTSGFSPPVASRALAYTGLTLYEALVPGMDDYQSLGGVLTDMEPLPAAGKNRAYHWPTVANAALAAIVSRMFPTTGAENVAAIASRAASFEDRFRARSPRGVFERSVRRGGEVAAAVFEYSRGDGGHEGYLNNFPPFTPPVGPGLWVPTAPGFQSALQPYWGRNRCFAIDAGSECSPGDHPAYSDDPSSAFYAEGIEVYQAVNNLTPEQEAVALHWSDDPEATPTPPGHSFSIATQLLRREEASLALAAEVYAKVGMAVADAFIACWFQKYRYNLLRPVTYIQQLVDPDWMPPLITPPFPEYTSGHSVQSASAFEILGDLFGDHYTFVDRTHEERGFAPRRFNSFREAADEAAISRLYGGIHYKSAIVNGVTQGRCIGRAVNRLPLRE
jgi:hypothetical protein